MRLTLRRATQRVARAIKPDFDQPDWRPILRASRDAWREARRAARTGPGVLIATTVGGHPPSTTIESLLAVALTLRGARVHVTLCDERLPACLRSHITAVESDAAFAAEGPQGSTCAGCYVSGRALYRSLGLPVHLLSELVSAEESRRAAAIAATIAAGEIPSFRLDGLNIGEHAQAGALRFYARGTLEDPASEAVLRRYFEAGLLTAFAIERLLDTTQIAAACFNHGIYIPHGVIGDVMRKRHVRLANWNPAYRKQTFIFSHGDTYHHTLMDEPVTEWEGVAWTAAREADLMAYLRSRWQGSQDWITFNANPEESRDAIARALNIDFQKPTIGLLTNVIWDAQLHYRANAFPNMMDWLIRTIAYFDRRRDLQLVIRVHPAEVTGAVPSRQTVVDELRQHFATLPPNVFVIPPDSPISTYVVTTQCDSVLIYGTKTGVELSCEGIPVIVAGEAWIRNKGLTMDARSPEDYFSILDRLPTGRRMDEETIARARRYAYHFFFRRMIPLRAVAPTTGMIAKFLKYRLDVKSLDALRPGADPGLDIICDGIMSGSPFVYPAEEAQG